VIVVGSIADEEGGGGGGVGVTGVGVGVIGVGVTIITSLTKRVYYVKWLALH
jgi:hypothetical protein